MDLQDGPVYGPVNSRRLGRSLGVNLAPLGRKTCNFACAYCQYGWADLPTREQWPPCADVIEAVDRALEACNDIDRITVAGNGEPTLHPAFASITEGLFEVRARRAPKAKLALVSNGSTLDRLDVICSLIQFEERYMRLDAGDAKTFRLVNGPSLPLARLIANLRTVGRLTLQSTFVRDADGIVDNMTPRAVDAWLDAVDQIRPDAVHLCSLHHRPARASVTSAPEPVLREIADRVSSLGIRALVFV